MNNPQKIKRKVKERYTRVALTGDSCCSPLGTLESVGVSVNENVFLKPLKSTAQVSKLVGYDSQDLKSIPEASILGAGCGTPTKFAFIKESIIVN